MSDPFELPPLEDESGLSAQGRLRRERELLQASIKRAERRLKEMDKRKKETTE